MEWDCLSFLTAQSPRVLGPFFSTINSGPIGLYCFNLKVISYL